MLLVLCMQHINKAFIATSQQESKKQYSCKCDAYSRKNALILSQQQQSVSIEKNQSLLALHRHAVAVFTQQQHVRSSKRAFSRELGEHLTLNCLKFDDQYSSGINKKASLN